ncbi:hypothetical protein ACTFQF_00270 [Aliivibrio fischeri]|uniref:hypothetical protein n=1 Tax=Aliivibrio fischeri TaxID=668 RepID=UPI0007C5948B|nr:hypothetical protein [Aliivibrio fischeri]
MQDHIDLLNSLRFKRGSKAILFKLVNSVLSNIGNMDAKQLVRWVYSETDVISSGKIQYKLAYDGSLFLVEHQARLGKSTINEYNSASEFRSIIHDYFGIGDILAFPIEVVTEERPLSFWFDVARVEYLRKYALEVDNKLISRARYEVLSLEAIDYYIEMLHGYALVMNTLMEITPTQMSAKEWNEAHLELINPQFRDLYTDKEC